MKFADVSRGSGAENTGWSQAVAAVDIDGDGWQDPIVGNDFGVNSYYRNNGDDSELARDVGEGSARRSSPVIARTAEKTASNGPATPSI